jgi:CRISPR system Cascade subunit CasA
MSSTVNDLLSDRLDTPVAVLRAENPVSFTVASDAVLLAEAAAKALGRVVEGPLLKFDEATGRYKVPEGKTDQAAAARRAIGEDLFAALDGPFRDFLSTLGDESDVSGARRRWSMVVGEYARAIARRTVVTWSAADVFTGALAEGWFQHDLARARDEFSPSDHEAKEVG